MANFASASDLLAAVAAAVVAGELAYPKLAERREDVDAIVAGDSSLEQRLWERPFESLLAHPGLAHLPDSIGPADSVAKMADLVRALQILDIWHMPLDLTQRLARTEDHYEADDRLHELGRYNEDESVGLVVPARVAGGVIRIGGLETTPDPFERLVQASPGALWPWTEYTTFLPPSIAGQDPDEMGGPIKAGRLIKVRYHRLPLSQVRDPVLPDVPRIAIAPVMQSGAETELRPSDDGRSYGFVACYSKRRIRELMSEAARSGAHLFFMPEASIDQANLPYLAQCIREEIAKAGTPGAPSPLAYVMAGIGALHDGVAPGRNYLVLFNRDGRILFEQDKLSHWNITRVEQEMFGIDMAHPGLGDPIVEFSRPGDTVHIVDIDGLGRFANLICSDISPERPGDWLILNARLDWLHAPILDKSVCWVKKPAKPPWPVRRAERAIVAFRGRMAVTNSMSLSEWLSDADGRRAAGFGRFDQVGIALLLDGSGAEIRQKLVFARAGAKSALCESLDWDPAYWSGFPDPPFV